MTDSCILSLLVPPEIRDDLTDWLLAFHQELTFTSQAVDHHGVDPMHLETAEQVSGRQRRLEVAVHLPAEELESLLEELRGAFPEAGWPYWVVPRWFAGRLG